MLIIYLTYLNTIECEIRHMPIFHSVVYIL